MIKSSLLRLKYSEFRPYLSKVLITSLFKSPVSFFKSFQMKMELFCPDQLDIEKESKKKPLVNSEGKKIKPDHLHFIVHCIMQQRASKDDEHLKRIGKKDGFVPLHSKILESKIPNYHDAIEWLINADVIECDEKYSRGNVSLGYRLKSPYRGNQIKRVDITDFVLCRKIALDEPFRKNKSTKQLSYLAKWFKTEKLEIDEQTALNWINDFEAAELQTINFNQNLKSSKKLEEKEKLFEKCGNYKILVSRIKEKDYFFHRDETGNRLHTNLTNLPKGLRQFITYDGEELVSIDIKNSQPYMSLAFLNKEFWQSQIVPEIVTLKKISKEIYKEKGKNKKEKNNTIKFGVSSQNLVQLDFQKMEFVKSVIGGQFYEYLIGVFEKHEEMNLGYNPKEKRDRVKKMVLTLLFDDDSKIYNQQGYSACQIFKRTFPSIAKIFAFIKQGSYKNLAILLQRIESCLLLEKACCRIAKERPFLPIFTIHDSIITTVGNESYVQSVMKEELKRGIGYAPAFSVEYWQKENLGTAVAA